MESTCYDLGGRASIVVQALDTDIYLADGAQYEWPHLPLAMLTKEAFEHLHGLHSDAP